MSSSPVVISPRQPPERRPSLAFAGSQVCGPDAMGFAGLASAVEEPAYALTLLLPVQINLCIQSRKGTPARLPAVSTYATE